VTEIKKRNSKLGVVNNKRETAKAEPCDRWCHRLQRSNRPRYRVPSRPRYCHRAWAAYSSPRYRVYLSGNGSRPLPPLVVLPLIKVRRGVSVKKKER